MISFESDYNNGCHEAILKRLIETNDERATGYGLDDFCNAARDKVRAACEMPDATSSSSSAGPRPTLP